MREEVGPRKTWLPRLAASAPLLLALAGPVACGSTPSESVEATPRCDCACAPATATQAAGPGVATLPAGVTLPAPVASAPPVEAAGRGADLVVAANRRMMHEDGAGCLKELDELRALDGSLESHLGILRAQCEMLVGRCQPGKDRVTNYYMKEMAMSRERAEKMAESIGAMRCRSGDSNERDRFLRAAQELSEGAYIDKKPVAFCRERIAALRELGPRVPAKEFDDGTVTGSKQALFYTSAACYARAGDCAAAFAIYAELFPQTGFAAGTEQAVKDGVIRSSFDSSIERCRK